MTWSCNAKTYNGSYITGTSCDDSRNEVDSNATLPAPFYYADPLGSHMKNYQHILAGFCDMSDSFCSFKYDNGTIIKAKPVSMDDQCILWDSSCSGDRTLAIEKFYNTAFLLGSNSCFGQTPGAGSTACVRWNPHSRLLEWQKIWQWMKTPQCLSAFKIYDEINGIINGNSEEFIRDDSRCCLRCYIQAEDVDLYYWPEPDPDTSCLSIIGESIRPLDYGATKVLATVLREMTETVDTVTYWGCTRTRFKTDFLACHGHLQTGYSRDIVTTAKVTTIGSLSVKISVYSPWSSVPCRQEDTAPQSSLRKVEPRAQVRNMSIPSSITREKDLPVSTVLDDFTL